MRTRLHADWRIWSELVHPHVLPVSDYGAGNDSLYVATQWLDGPSLRAVLDQRRALDAAQVGRLARQLAGALDAAAVAGLVHLDVKPENVLFDGTEHAYLRDFGAGRLAARQAGVGRSGAFRGTVEYAAPEQIEGDAADGRTLVYALGCLLYEALTGATPYAGRSSAALMRAHVEEAPPLVRGGAADVDRVFAKALAKRRDDRFATCTDFAGALDAALAAAPAPHPARAARRRPPFGLRAATAAAFVAFVAAGAATAASWLTQDAPRASAAAPDKPLSNREFMAALPNLEPTVKAARKQVRAAPSGKHVSTRKASSTPTVAARPKHHSVARTAP